jgi:Na+/proline symporter
MNSPSTPLIYPAILLVYFLILLVIGWLTKGKSDNATFFKANRSSPWLMVAFGMIGASLSGVTFISIPGDVGHHFYFYFQLVMGYIVGYVVIAFVLLPLYYRLNLTTIYTYLDQRFGNASYKTGAFFFLISRSIGSALRLFLVAIVLQMFISDHLSIPFEITVFTCIALIWIYSFKGGIKTIVYTDTLQTFFMLSALGIILVFLWNEIKLTQNQSILQFMFHNDFSQMMDYQLSSKTFFGKNFLSGMFITIGMTGLDQDMMQKNLTCRNVKDAQKNMLLMAASLIPINLLFLLLGSLLYTYALSQNIINTHFHMPDMMMEGKHISVIKENIFLKKDHLFPFLSSHYLPFMASIFFFIGLVASAYSSADSALTSLTTSFCVDFLGFSDTKGKVATRQWIHAGFSFLILVLILLFRKINNDSVINDLFTMAGYTYGPLLGLFGFGMSNSRIVKDGLVPIICLLSPLLMWKLPVIISLLFPGFDYKFGFEIIIITAFFTYLGLWMISKPTSQKSPVSSPSE